MYASAVGAKELVTRLLSAGASLDKKDDRGRTALGIANEYGRTEVIGMLKKQAALNA